MDAKFVMPYIIIPLKWSWLTAPTHLSVLHSKIQTTENSRAVCDEISKMADKKNVQRLIVIMGYYYGKGKAEV